VSTSSTSLGAGAWGESELAQTEIDDAVATEPHPVSPVAAKIPSAELPLIVVFEMLTFESYGKLAIG
jgi:hypothetical protein